MAASVAAVAFENQVLGSILNEMIAIDHSLRYLNGDETRIVNRLHFILL